MIIELFNFKVGQKVRYKDGSIYTIRDFVPAPYNGDGTEKFLVHFEGIPSHVIGLITYTRDNNKVHLQNFERL